MYFKRLGSLRAVTLSLIYLMTPYLFLNIFVRGTLGEILAQGLIPWVLVSYQNLDENKKGLQWYHPLPLALLLLAHNFLGILFAVFLIGYLILSNMKKSIAIRSLLLSFGLAAFFIVPMIFEKNLLYSVAHNFLTFRYDQHFVYWRQFLYGKWDYWYSVPGPDDGLSFQLGFAPMVLTLLGMGAIVSQKKKKLVDLYLLVAYVGCLFLMTSRSDFIWRHITILQTVQFPWRLLFMPAILSPLIGSYFLARLKNPRVLLVTCIAIVSLGFWNVRNYRRPIKYLNLTEYTDLYRLYYNKTSTTFRTEILPQWSGENERYKSDELLVNSGNMIVNSLSYGPLFIDAEINDKPDPSEARVTLLRNFYPGWKLTVDGGKSVELKPDGDGMITFTPALGVHHYRLQMHETPLEAMSDLVSLSSFVVVLYMGVRAAWTIRRKK
jgi:hypothetical protein